MQVFLFKAFLMQSKGQTLLMKARKIGLIRRYDHTI